MGRGGPGTLERDGSARYCVCAWKTLMKHSLPAYPITLHVHCITYSRNPSFPNEHFFLGIAEEASSSFLLLFRTRMKRERLHCVGPISCERPLVVPPCSRFQTRLGRDEWELPGPSLPRLASPGLNLAVRSDMAHAPLCAVAVALLCTM